MKFNRKHIACLFAMASVFCVFSSKVYANEDQKALKGVYIENIDVCNMTEAEAKRAVKSYVENITNQNVTLTLTMYDTNVDNNGYSWDDEEHYGNTTTKTISNNGTYVAYVKDLA